MTLALAALTGIALAACAGLRVFLPLFAAGAAGASSSQLLFSRRCDDPLNPGTIRVIVRLLAAVQRREEKGAPSRL